MCLLEAAAGNAIMKKRAEGKDKTAVRALASKGGSVLGGSMAGKALVGQAKPQASTAAKAVKKNTNSALKIAKNY